MAQESILIGRGNDITEVPRKDWERELAQVPQRMKTRLSFMTEEHHRVRYFVVRELPRVGEPLTVDYIAAQLGMSIPRVTAIVIELERNLTFLYRNPQGIIAWAYPVTTDQTPHELTFSSGERLYAA